LWSQLKHHIPNVLFLLDLVFLNLRIYLHFRYETSIPTHVLIIISVLKGNFCVLQLACGALGCSGSSSTKDSSMTPCSVHSLFVLCVSWKWLLFVLFVLHLSVGVFFFFGSDSEVMNDHVIEKIQVNDK
jgi:hypothetical protein